MKKTKRKALNRRLKRVLARYKSARNNFLIPRYQRDVLYREREVLF